MAVTYPPPPPTQVGEITQVHQLLNSPDLVQRRVRDLSLNRFISDVLLTQVLPAESGSVAYEQGESQFTERDPEIVRPGQEYPRTAVGIGPQQIASVAKWGQDVPVTDEAIKNTRLSPVERAFRKIVNQNVRKIDSISLAAIASQVTATIAASTSWMGTGATTILRDALRAVAKVRALDEGFELDTLVVDDELWAYVASDAQLAAILARESSDNVVYSGQFPQVAGLRLLPTNNLPPIAGGAVLAVDSTQLGGMADQDLAGGYTGALRGVQTKTIREDKTDSYLLRGRRVTVPVVLEPGAGILITGARS